MKPFEASWRQTANAIVCLFQSEYAKARVLSTCNISLIYLIKIKWHRGKDTDIKNNIYIYIQKINLLYK